MWAAQHKLGLHHKHWIYVMWVQKFNSQYTPTSIACATSNVHSNQMRRTSAVWRDILVCMLSGYCLMAYRTGSATHSELMCIISSTCNRDQLAYCSNSKAHNFAQESPIEKIKVPFWSAINVLSGGVLMSVSTKCGEWVVYAEPVTNCKTWYTV